MIFFLAACSCYFNPSFSDRAQLTVITYTNKTVNPMKTNKQTIKKIDRKGLEDEKGNMIMKIIRA